MPLQSTKIISFDAKLQSCPRNDCLGAFSIVHHNMHQEHHHQNQKPFVLLGPKNARRADGQRNRQVGALNNLSTHSKFIFQVSQVAEKFRATFRRKIAMEEHTCEDFVKKYQQISKK